MLKRLIASLLVLLSFTSCAAMDYKRQAYNSVAMVKFEGIDPKTKEDDYITGTAFAVDENHLVTAGHVCKAGIEKIVLQYIDNFSVYLIFFNKDEGLTGVKDFRIVDLDLENDLCLIYKKSHGLVPVTFATKEVKARDPIFIVGAPAGNFPVECDGYVSIPSANFDGNEWKDRIMMSIDIYGGNSGGPIYNSDGYVVGMVSAGDRRYLHMGIAVKSKYIVNFLKAYSDKQVKVKIKQK